MQQTIIKEIFNKIYKPIISTSLTHIINKLWPILKFANLSSKGTCQWPQNARGNHQKLFISKIGLSSGCVYFCCCCYGKTCNYSLVQQCDQIIFSIFCHFQQ